MKQIKILLAVVTMILTALIVSSSVKAQQLNSDARFIKLSKSHVYANIEAQAIVEYPNNQALVVYEINRQADAFVDLIRMMNKAANRSNDQQLMLIERTISEHKHYENDNAENAVAWGNADFAMIVSEVNRVSKF